MYSLDTIYLFGNPIVNQNPQLAKIENNSVQLKKALEQYFGVSSSSGGIGGLSSGFGQQAATVIPGGGAVGGLSSGFGGLSLVGSAGPAYGGQHQTGSTASTNLNLGSLASSQGPSAKSGPSYGGGAPGLGASVSSASFLQSDLNMNDPAVLRKRIADLETENKRLKSEADSGSGSSGVQKGAGYSTMRQANQLGMPSQDKDWMNFGGSAGGALERPGTATTNQKVKDLQEEVKMERKEKKYLMDEIENLKKEL